MLATLQGHSCEGSLFSESKARHADDCPRGPARKCIRASDRPAAPRRSWCRETRAKVVIPTKTDRAIKGGYDRLSCSSLRKRSGQHHRRPQSRGGGTLGVGGNASDNSCLCCKSQAGFSAPTVPGNCLAGAPLTDVSMLIFQRGLHLPVTPLKHMTSDDPSYILFCPALNTIARAG